MVCYAGEHLRHFRDGYTKPRVSIRSGLSYLLPGLVLEAGKTRLAVCVRSRGSKIDPTCPLLMKHDVSNVLRGLGIECNGIIAISFVIR